MKLSITRLRKTYGQTKALAGFTYEYGRRRI